MKKLKITLALLITAGLIATCGLGIFAKNGKNSEADNKSGTEKVESSAKNSSSVEMKTAKISNQTWYLVENEQQLRSIGTGKFQWLPIIC